MSYTAGSVLSAVQSLYNDTDGAVITFAVMLPRLNMCLKELQEIFQLNNNPVTALTSDVIAVDAGDAEVVDTELPSDLVEIRQLWESPRDQNLWIPMKRVDFLPHYLEDQMAINQLLYWSYNDQNIQFIAANADNDIKMDYLADLFADLTVAEDVITVKGTQSFVNYRTASLCADFIGENETRANKLNAYAEMALERSLGISAKGRQAITTRRRPFRAGYKSLGWW